MRAALGLLALLAAAPVQASPCEGPVCNFDTLAQYFARRVSVTEAGAQSLHILQIGDSHTAGDAITGAWRELLQARIGKGGRGVLPPGLPYPGFRARGVTVATSPGWSIAATYGPGSTPPRPPLGLASYSLTATAPGASMRLTAAPEMAFDRFTLCAIGPGTVTATIGGETWPLDFPDTPRCETRYTAGPQTDAGITLTTGRVTITSWATFQEHAGITLSNLGVVGSQLAHFARTDDAVLRTELRAYLPDLIVLAFGTNEGFAPHFDANAYRATLIEQIDRLRALAPGVPILLLGPPDALSRNPTLKANAEGVLVGCPASDPSRPSLFAPPALGRVRAIQREVAAEMGVAWWDWYAGMGGPCAATRWVADGRMRGDYVHFTATGGRAIAQLLEADLEAAAEAR